MARDRPESVSAGQRELAMNAAAQRPAVPRLVAADARSTRFARCPRPLAGVICLATIALVMLCLASLDPTVALEKSPPASGTTRDLSLYSAVLQRLGRDEPYHAALGAELTARDYPAASIFNWRPPAHLWLLSRLPDPSLGKLVLELIAILCVALAWNVLRRDAGRWLAAAGALLLAASLLPCAIGDVYVFSEAWAGALMCCSALLLVAGRWRAAVVAALIAAFFREFALVYCVVACAVATFRGERTRAIAWAFTIAIALSYLGVHALQVMAHRDSGNVAPGLEWIRFGGLTFVMATARFNPLLLVLPVWAVALYLPFGLLGLIGWPSRDAVTLQLTVIGFLGLFLVIGKPVNYYWGLLYGPLLSSGLAWSPLAVRDLLRRLAAAP